MNTLINDAYKKVRIAETLQNVAIVHTPTFVPPTPDNKPFQVEDEAHFWQLILAHSSDYWGKICSLDGNWVLSEWIPRIPGLYWHKNSEALRNVHQSGIETIGQRHLVLQPIVKSMVVMGGVGTLKLPPETGFRLVSLSKSRDASAGIPVLVSNEVWNTLSLHEGVAIKGQFVWQQMSKGWSEHFPSISLIPNGYLLLSDAKNVIVTSDKNPVLFHPCTVMEYKAPNGFGLLYDYVFVSATTEQQSFKNAIQDFFEMYRTAQNRNGKYIFEADMTDKLWDARFKSPQDMLEKDDYSNSQLDILLSRVRGDTFKNGVTTEAMNKIILTNFGNNTEGLKLVASDIGIEEWEWYRNEPVAKLSIRLLDLCMETNKVDALLDSIIAYNPNILRT